MTSTLIVYKKDADFRGEREIAHFKVPIKAVFGRKFCDTDGSIGYNTDVSDRQMIEAVDECRGLTNILDARERADLDKLEAAALGGFHFRIEWVH
jgi:hypothetical protein